MNAIIWSLTFLGAIGFFIFQMWGRLRVLFKARRDDGRDYSRATWKKRIKNMVVFGFLQKKFFTGEQPAGLMHVIVFWGFSVLSLQVITMFTRGWFPSFTVPGLTIHFLGGPYGLLRDIFQIAVMAGVLMALYRWTISKPKRLFGILPAEEKLHGQKHWEAKVILVFIFTIMASGFFYDASRMISYQWDIDSIAEAKWQPLTSFLAGQLPGNVEAADCIAGIAWWVHNIVILIFLNLLPRSKHFHIITAMANVFFGKIEPKGRLPKKDYTAEDALFGRSQPNHFSWKQVLDMYSCTECGRCSEVCPAAITGKTLAPRQFLLNLRDSVYENQNNIIDGKTEFDVIIGENKAIIDDVVWSCVTCRACEEACPVNIEYVDKIIDIRQHLVQEAARFPGELNRTFQGLERNSNPWGISSAERFAWAEGLKVPTLAENPKAEYLYYVGCGGCFDGNHKKSAQALTKILDEAEVSYAVLGSEETCNGETARRLGNEYLFQSMAETLTEKINSYGVKKVITNCPHCFNTLKNDYPEVGGKWEVHNAADFVNDLVATEKIKVKSEMDKRVVYHDSCYNARFNDVIETPRNLIQKVTGDNAIEMKSNKKESMCCGAGGGRMWMEEQKDQRVNIARTEQALDKNPEVIAVSCPFCRIMMSSGVNEKGLGDTVQVMDIMEMVAQNLEIKNPPIAQETKL